MSCILFIIMHERAVKNLLYRILDTRLIKPAIIVCAILILPYYILAQDIETYMKDSQCSNTENSLCDSIENLRQALAILTKIQDHNFAIMKQSNITNTKEKDIANKTQKKEAKDLQKEDIAIVTYKEYQLLKQNMKKFCKSFERLNTDERKMLFTLKWNKNPIFQNHDDVMHFCKSKY